MGLGFGSIISVGGIAGSGTGGGGGSGSGSGIQIINPGNNTGPTVTFSGINGIEVTSPSTNLVLIDGIALSGAGCFSQTFGLTTSGFFEHGLGTRNLIVQVSNEGFPPSVIFPDQIIFDTEDAFSILFNRPQAGTVTAVSCGGVAESVTGATKFSQSFTNVSSVIVTHNLGTGDVLVQVKDNSVPPELFIPDKITFDNINTVTLSFNSLRSGKVVVIG